MVVEMMRRSKLHRTLMVVVAAVLLGGTSAQAALLNPGASLFPAPGEPDPTGGTVIASQTIPFNIPGFFDGSLASTVISGDPSNALGGLTFTYLLTNASTSPNAMARMTITDFTGFLTDASWQTPAAGVAPALIDRNTADVVGFNFSQQIGPGALQPGSNSALLVIQTNAPAFQAELANIIDSAAISVPSFGPLIPEPASLGLVAAAGLALVRRRSR